LATWGELLTELRELAADPEVPNPQDRLRAEAVQALHDYTGRNTIVYAAAHLHKQVSQGLVSIRDEDIEGFMETIYQLDDDSLDLVLHSPGGTPDAANSLVQYLRSKFTDLRVIVPHMAMSAATMLACAADRIVMGRHSQLGPIDPQLAMQTELGGRLVPAEAILQQFELAKEQCTDEETLAVWYPILRQYGPDLLIQCENARKHAEELVGQWLAEYMFDDREDGEELGEETAEKLAAHGSHLSHSRPLGRDYLRDELNLVIDDLEEDQELQDRVLTVYHAFNLTFTTTAATKIIENHLSRRFVKMTSPGGNGPQSQEPEEADPGPGPEPDDG